MRQTTLFVNGRFLSQPLSGVQRFATEVTAALQRLFPDRVVVLRPPGVPGDDGYGRAVGSRHGQSWEQFDLPRHAGGGVLINLGNTAPLRRRPRLVVIHDAGIFSTPEAYSWRFRTWYKFLQKRLIRSGARIVTVSEFARDEIVRHLGARPQDIAVISEGADHMAGIDADFGVIAALPAGRFVLAVGNLAVHKNLRSLTLLASALQLRGVTLVIAGGLAGRAFQAGGAVPPANAFYTGRVSDAALKALYLSAACLVVPSLYEGFGLPAIEAMACGCPVAASSIPAFLEVCGSAAIFFDPKSPDDIAEQVCRLVDDQSLEYVMRARARAHAERFTWQRAAEQLASAAADCA